MTERENLFRPIHKGIRSMLYRLGTEIQTADFTDPHVSDRIAQQLENALGDAGANCILCLLRTHSSHEERDIFVPVRRQDPDVIDLMIREHLEVSRRIAGLSRTCNELRAQADPKRRIEIGDRLGLEANDLFAYYLAHLNNEEATIVPVMWERFTDDELREMRAKFYDALPLPRFEEWMRWTLPALNIHELTVLYSGLQRAPRSARLDDWVRLARESLPPAEWEQLRNAAGLPRA